MLSSSLLSLMYHSLARFMAFGCGQPEEALRSLVENPGK